MKLEGSSGTEGEDCCVSFTDGRSIEGMAFCGVAATCPLAMAPRTGQHRRPNPPDADGDNHLGISSKPQHAAGKTDRHWLCLRGAFGRWSFAEARPLQSFSRACTSNVRRAIGSNGTSFLPLFSWVPFFSARRSRRDCCPRMQARYPGSGSFRNVERKRQGNKVSERRRDPYANDWKYYLVVRIMPLSTDGHPERLPWNCNSNISVG